MAFFLKKISIIFLFDNFWFAQLLQIYVWRLRCRKYSCCSTGLCRVEMFRSYLPTLCIIKHDNILIKFVNVTFFRWTFRHFILLTKRTKQSSKHICLTFLCRIKINSLTFCYYISCIIFMHNVFFNENLWLKDVTHASFSLRIEQMLFDGLQPGWRRIYFW